MKKEIQPTMFEKMNFVKEAYNILMTEGERSFLDFCSKNNIKMLKKEKVGELYEFSRLQKLNRKRVKLENTPIIKNYLDGRFICEYSSIIEAAEITKLDSNKIKKALTNKPNTYGGFIWKRKTNDN